MINRKNAKMRGKIRLSQYFQELKEGDKVAIIREQSAEPKFPIRIQGKNGIVIGHKGSACILKVKEGNAEKIHIIKPVHLLKLK
ncbi:MAG: 50S ribosomal protein L21e [archaeon]|nr:50S ribosomal protein L21e [archaeon]